MSFLVELSAEGSNIVMKPNPVPPWLQIAEASRYQSLHHQSSCRHRFGGRRRSCAPGAFEGFRRVRFRSDAAVAVQSRRERGCADVEKW